MERIACTTCGSNWCAGEYQVSCNECGGGALERPCIVCGGKCGAVLTRMVMDSQDAGEAHWIGSCKLPKAEQMLLLQKAADQWKAEHCIKPEIVSGDLLDQDVDVIVNAWNRNIIPWWLLLPQGVSGANKKRGGSQPFRELGRLGAIPLGEARLTSAGKLPFKAIIHVAGINMLWRASEASIRGSVRNALALVNEHDFQSVAFPIIGGGTGSFKTETALSLMLEELASLRSAARVVIVKYCKNPPGN